MTEESAAADRWLAATWVALLAYPWLNPVSGGPSSSVQPWLASALCAALLVAQRGWQRPAFPPALWIALAAVATSLRDWPALESVTAGGALLVIVGVAGIVSGEGRERFVRAIATAWVIAACGNALFALLQYFGAGDAFAPWVSHAALGEAYGNLRQRNQLATALAIGLAALVWFVGRGLRLRTALAPIVLLAAGCAASASRTGALEWAVLVALAVLWRSERRREKLIASAVGLVAYAVLTIALPLVLEHGWGVAGASVFQRFANESGCGSRRVLWSNVLHLIAQRPWTGWGWGELDYAHYMTLYPGERFCDILDNAHSLPLHLAVELGVPVAVIACAGLVAAFARIAPWREADPDRQLALSVIAVILVHSLLEYPLWYGPFELAFGLSLGILWPGGASVSGRAQGASAVAAGLAIAAIAYAGWDYHRVSQIYLAPESRDAKYREDPLPAIHKSLLFRAQARFAELTITPLTRANAGWTYREALDMLHYSPEPRVIEKVIESATMLGHPDVALAHLARYRAAFPREHAEWARTQAGSVARR